MKILCAWPPSSTNLLQVKKAVASQVSKPQSCICQCLLFLVFEDEGKIAVVQSLLSTLKLEARYSHSVLVVYSDMIAIPC